MGNEPFRPATIADRATWNRIANDPQIGPVLKRHFADLDKIEPTKPLPTAVDYLAARRSNDRARLDRHWQHVRPNFGRLAVHRLLKGIDASDADDRLLNWTFAFIYEPTWTASAHLPNNDLPLSGTGQLDLAGCEAAGELAEALEVLRPWIDSNSQTLGDTIIREIDRRVLTPIMNESPWWANEHAMRTGEKRLNNWTGVCAGSILAACLSFEATGLPRVECRDKMIRLLRTYFDVGFSESGECDEGIAYWNYGIEFAVLGMSRMTSTQVRDSFDMDRINLVAGYPERSHLIGRLFFVGNDGDSLADCSPSSTPWLADLVGSDFLHWWSGQGKGSTLRTLPHLLRLLKRSSAAPTTTLAAPAHEPTRLLVDQQAALFQRPTPRGLFTFTVAGGTNGELHNHNDLGTFQLFFDDRAVIPDLGAPNYTTDYFKDETRYTKYIVAASSGHCCPAVNGVEQRAGKEAAGKLLAWQPEASEIALDLTSAYPPEAKLKRWTRAARVPADDAVAIVTDEFQLDGDGVVVHRIWFVDEPKVSDAGATILAGGVSITLEPKPASADVMKIKAGDGRLMLRGYKPEKELYRVDLTYQVKAEEKLVATTRITVG